MRLYGKKNYAIMGASGQIGHVVIEQLLKNVIS